MTVGYAVLNTERDVFVKLGQHGPHVTASFERAKRQADTEDHLTTVEVRGDFQ